MKRDEQVYDLIEETRQCLQTRLPSGAKPQLSIKKNIIVNIYALDHII